MSTALHTLSATEARALLAKRAISAEELVRACLARIEEREPEVAAWAHAFLGRVANRIINEVRGINCVTYDITSKSHGTIEWE